MLYNLHFEISISLHLDTKMIISNHKQYLFRNRKRTINVEVVAIMTILNKNADKYNNNHYNNQ